MKHNPRRMICATTSEETRIKKTSFLPKRKIITFSTSNANDYSGSKAEEEALSYDTIALNSRLIDKIDYVMLTLSTLAIIAIITPLLDVRNEHFVIRNDDVILFFLELLGSIIICTYIAKSLKKLIVYVLYLFIRANKKSKLKRLKETNRNEYMLYLFNHTYGDDVKYRNNRIWHRDRKVKK